MVGKVSIFEIVIYTIYQLKNNSVAVNMKANFLSVPDFMDRIGIRASLKTGSRSAKNTRKFTSGFTGFFAATQH